MTFEIKDRDLAGRIGKIKTKNGVIETPAFFPVINPIKNIIPIKAYNEKFRIRNIITNAYIIKNAYDRGLLQIKDLHELLDFKEIIMTDSGAYQILTYGKVNLKPTEIIELQEQLNSDIAVILDIPTPREASKNTAAKTVERTLKNAAKSIKTITRKDIIWIGPVQGGKHLELVKKCAKEIGEMDFQMHGIGGPTQFMETYKFEELVDIIITAKRNLPLERPVHLFGAGHPILLPILVALGCDTFDSASYILYAKDDRYITSNGTTKLSKLQYLPCNCPICRRYDAEEMRKMSKKEREQLLAEHNLWKIIQEMKKIKQAIVEGSLWELIEQKAKSHPQLYNAILRLSKYKSYLEEFDPITKGQNKGVFYTTSEGLIRPEVTRHINKLRYNVRFPGKEILLLMPEQRSKPYHKNKKVRRLISKIEEKLREDTSSVHICIYGIPFGIIPLEIDEVHPLSQHEKARLKDINAEYIIIEALEALISNNNYKKALIIFNKDVQITNKTIRNMLEILETHNIIASAIETNKEDEIIAKIMKIKREK